VRRLSDKFGAAAAARVVDACRESGFVELGMLDIDCAGERGGCVRLRLTEKGGMFENTVVSVILDKAIWRHQATGGGVSAQRIEGLPRSVAKAR
jgi:hypothetical protein